MPETAKNEAEKPFSSNAISVRAQRTANLRPFPPGVSGNPGGVPKHLKEARELCRATSLQATKRLIDLMDSPDDRVAIVAVKEMLDRGMGKAKEAEPDVPDPALVDVAGLTGEERQQLRSILKAAMERQSGVIDVAHEDITPPSE